MEVKRQHNVVVSKDTAVFLREHGHNEYCDCYLHTDNDSQDDYEMWPRNQHCNSDLPDSAERIAAPYVCDALIWLMQNFHARIKVYNDGPGYSYHMFLWSVGVFSEACDDDFQEAIYKRLDKWVEKQK